jgi:hypothetical protein
VISSGVGLERRTSTRVIAKWITIMPKGGEISEIKA